MKHVFNDCFGEGSIFCKAKVISMEKRLSQVIGEYDQIIVAIGSEWDWISTGIKGDERYQELIAFCEEDSNKWLLPIIEFEYGYYNNDDRIDEAYKALRKLIGDKPHFLISEIFIHDALLNGFDEKYSVYPCGNYRYLQTTDVNDSLLDVTVTEDFNALVDKIHKIITEKNGHLTGEERFAKPFQYGQNLFLNQKRLE